MTTSARSVSVSPEVKAKIHSLLFGSNQATDVEDDDVSRWFNQGFEFCIDPKIGLRQRSGGPCGVLAAINAEVVKYVYFDIYSDMELENELIEPDNEVLFLSLAKSIQAILQRASDSDYVSICSPSNHFYHGASIEKLEFDCVEIPKGDECFELLYNQVNAFTSDYGCLIFVLSLILSRSIEKIKNDMDDRNNTLVGRFGHTTQELINLLLTGRATSNAIDGEEVLGDSGILLRGVMEPSSIGYLTHLESYGHCRVGDYFKYPEYPIWVVGSSSHFSLLFGVKQNVNEQSSIEKIMTKLRRVFNSVDVEKCGFIPSSKLPEVLKALEIDVKEEANVQRLQKLLQVEGDIIIWGLFCEHLSKLLDGEPLDRVLGTDRESGKRPRSDSEVARYFQEAFDSGVEPEPLLEHQIEGRYRSDSDIARALQADFDNNGQISYSADSAKAPYSPEAVAAPPSMKQYTLFYFNGLEGPKKAPRLTKFSISIEESVERVGSQVALAGSTVQGGGIYPIEEVLRTRWPGCKISWNGEHVPNID